MKVVIHNFPTIAKVIIGLGMLFVGASLLGNDQTSGVWVIFGVGAWLGYAVGRQPRRCTECGWEASHCPNPECRKQFD
ncbi:MAG: hypothetical protein WB812_08240 [Woeseiaceae bacterium]